MSYRIEYTATAKSDVQSVMSYIKYELSNNKAASDLYDDVQRVLDRLKINPLMFPLSPNPVLAEASVRRANIRGYNMYYKLTDGSVYIIRFVSTLMDQDSVNFISSVTKHQ